MLRLICLHTRQRFRAGVLMADKEKSMEEQEKIAQLEKDCTTLALRLLGEDPDTFAPETFEVMERWKPKCIELLNGQAA